VTAARPVTLLLATTNVDKIGEMRQLLSDLPVRLVTLADLPREPEPEETGLTFAENARQKAQFYARRLSALIAPASARTLTLAEDSGLEIDALGGEPGVRSARFLGPHATYPQRFEEIYRRLRAAPDAPWTARFVCAVAVVENGQFQFETVGTVEGRIADRPSGGGGFGYDPIFWYPPLAATLAEVSRHDKATVSHRGAALRGLAHWLRSQQFSRT
jgi:XTP/dITP diphosphohydrolase